MTAPRARRRAAVAFAALALLVAPGPVQAAETEPERAPAAETEPERARAAETEPERAPAAEPAPDAAPELRAVTPPPVEATNLPPPFQRPARVFADGRERWTLLRRPLANRQLDLQLEGRPWRLGTDLGPVTAAADVTIGTQQSPWVAEKTRFHGWFLVDAFLAVRPFEQLDLNLNVLILNPSASDAYRGSAEILPGFSAHLHGAPFTLAGGEVRADLLLHDLGRMTLGQGLMVEEIPLEGVLGSLRWRGLEARAGTGGRVFWSEDDLIFFELTAFERRLGAQVIVWPTTFVEAPEEETEPLLFDYGYPAYVGLFGEVQPLRHLRFAAEASVRVDRGELSTAALLRADWLDWTVGRLALHAGYQLRWYQQGFGPVLRPAPPSTLPNHLWREDTYITNAFEFLQASSNYHQWSQTLMLEARSPLVGPWWLVAELEAWVRFVSDPAEDATVRYLPDGTRLPAVLPRFSYRAGVQLIPWSDRALRASLLLSNRLVNTATSVRTPVADRFTEVPQLVFELEVVL